MSDYAVDGVVEVRVSAELSKTRRVGEIIANALKEHGYELISLSGERYCARGATRRNCFITLIEKDRKDVVEASPETEVSNEQRHGQ